MAKQFLDVNHLLRLIDEEKTRHSRAALESPPSEASLFDYGKAVGFMAGLSQIRDVIIERISQEEDHDDDIRGRLVPDPEDADSDSDGDEFGGYVP